MMKSTVWFRRNSTNIVMGRKNSFKLPISLLIRTNMHMEYSTMILSSQFRTKICRIAARVGNLSALQWVRNPVTPKGRSEELKSCPWDTLVCSEAAAGGLLELLQWARSEGCPWDSITCSNATRAGHLQIFQWARSLDCPWDIYTCFSAAIGGHFAVLQWVRS